MSGATWDRLLRVVLCLADTVLSPLSHASESSAAKPAKIGRRNEVTGPEAARDAASLAWRARAERWARVSLADAPVALTSCSMMFACCGVAVLDRADQMLLPAAYYEVARAFDGELSPTTLGLITLGRGVATSLVALPAAVLSNRFHRCRVVAGGALLW